MALLKRKSSAAAGAAGSSKEIAPQSAKKQPKADKKATKAEAPAAAAAASAVARRRLLGWLALLGALYSAACEWPVYLAYEKDWRRPAMGFTMNFSITAAIALLVACSPPVRSLKTRPAADGSNGLSRDTKRKLAATFFLIVLPLYFGFGPYGPSGALTVAGLIAFIFLALP